MERKVKKSIIAGLYGNALEWYDFMLYASFASIFAKLFFPTDTPFLSLMATFGVFAIGFFIRPLGGMLLGQYADHAGRKKALIASVVIMTTTTGAIAFLPNYQSAGMLAPILFTLLRLVQGLAVGGELPGSATFLIEHMFAERRGLAGSLVLCTACFGIFMGSLVTALLSWMIPYEGLMSWGWRIAYLLGGVLGIYGIYLRLNSSEPDTFLEVKKIVKNPVKHIFIAFRPQLLLSVMVTSILAMSNYLMFAYVSTVLIHQQSFLFKDAITINLIALFFMTLLIPLMGILSDQYGRKTIFMMGLFGLILSIFPIFMWLHQGSWWSALFAEILLSVVISPLNATVPTILAEVFPTTVRASGSSIGYNLGQAAFGGTFPLIALSLVESTTNFYAPACYVLIWGLIVFITVRTLSRLMTKEDQQPLTLRRINDHTSSFNTISRDVDKFFV